MAGIWFLFDSLEPPGVSSRRQILQVHPRSCLQVLDETSLLFWKREPGSALPKWRNGFFRFGSPFTVNKKKGTFVSSFFSLFRGRVAQGFAPFKWRNGFLSLLVLLLPSTKRIEIPFFFRGRVPQGFAPFKWRNGFLSLLALLLPSKKRRYFCFSFSGTCASRVRAFEMVQRVSFPFGSPFTVNRMYTFTKKQRKPAPGPKRDTRCV